MRSCTVTSPVTEIEDFQRMPEDIEQQAVSGRAKASPLEGGRLQATISLSSDVRLMRWNGMLLTPGKPHPSSVTAAPRHLPPRGKAFGNLRRAKAFPLRGGAARSMCWS